MPECRDCGKKRLAWVETGKGYVLYELGAPHFVHCPNKNGAADYVPAHSENALTAIEALGTLGVKPTEAKKILEGVPEGEPPDMVLAALQKMGADEAS